MTNIIDVRSELLRHGVSDVFADNVAAIVPSVLFQTTVRVLVVVDGSVSLTESPSGFGVGRVVRLLREHSGCPRYRVDLARRGAGAMSINTNPSPSEPRYSSFRFDGIEGEAPVLHRYDEVWCFGFEPGNDAGDDSNITLANKQPTTDAELAALTTWMNERRGGLLAMGDHDYLGASMCHRIPRIGSMRRWTNAQGVPPIGGAANPDTWYRMDTNQPRTLAQIGGTATIPFSNQEDAVPQQNEWTPWAFHYAGLFTSTRPHPILCHPTLGPIDVLPDHPHEGWLFEDDEIDPNATFDFGSIAGEEYPAGTMGRPMPTVIAHGWTTPNPPYLLAKGPSPKRRFAQISAYDGHSAGVGRVVTDATWHHWFDENIQSIEAAGGDNWEKIRTYYLNVARWLAPPRRLRWCWIWEIIVANTSSIGFQEFSRGASTLSLGITLRDHLTPKLGPCWVTEFVLDEIFEVDVNLGRWIIDSGIIRGPQLPPIGPDPCLTCPPFEIIELHVLGGLARASIDATEALLKNRKAKGKAASERVLREMEASLHDGALSGIRDFREGIKRSLETLAQVGPDRTGR